MTAGRPSPPWDGDVFSGRVLITHKIMAIARTIGGQVGKIVWREVNRGWEGQEMEILVQTAFAVDSS